MTEADTHVAHPESRISAPDKSYTAWLGPDALWWNYSGLFEFFLCVYEAKWMKTVLQ